MSLRLPTERAAMLGLWAVFAAALSCLFVFIGRTALPWLDSLLHRFGWKLAFTLPAKVVTPVSIVVAVYVGLVLSAVIVERPKRSSLRHRPPLIVIYLLLALPVIAVGLFMYVPAASALSHAFTRWDVGAESTWVGLANFREMFADPVFLQSCWNLLRLGLVVFIAHLGVPFVVAEMIYHLRSERAGYWCRVAVVLPMIVPGVVVFLIWVNIYSDIGLVTEFLIAVGLDDWVRGWLSDPKTALWAVACVGFPFAVGVNVLIYYAGLANIPKDVLEAAELDGLGSTGRIVRIHLPLVLSQAKLLVVLTVIAVVNGFESVLILTQDGGPGYETMVPGLYMYLNGFLYQRMGYGCAIGLAMFAFILFFSVLTNRLLREED